jgi:hypothetical protein
VDPLARPGGWDDHRVHTAIPAEDRPGARSSPSRWVHRDEVERLVLLLLLVLQTLRLTRLPWGRRFGRRRGHWQPVWVIDLTLVGALRGCSSLADAADWLPSD